MAVPCNRKIVTIKVEVPTGNAKASVAHLNKIVHLIEETPSGKHAPYVVRGYGA